MPFRTLIVGIVLFSCVLPAAMGQRVGVTGHVKDIHGSPIPFASILEKRAKTGSKADSSGAFSVMVKPGDSLVITAVGYRDTIVSSTGGGPLSVVLRRSTGDLGEAIVSGTTTRPGYSAQDIATQQIITGAFQEYVTGAMFSNGVYTASSVVPGLRGGGGIVTTRINAVGPLNTINAGTMLPIVSHQEETRGTRYLLRRFVPGVLVDKDQHVIVDSSRLLNYDKIDGQLLIAQGGGKYLEVDKDKILAFAMKTEDSSFVFLNVQALSKVNYFLLIATGPKYSVYKSVKTKFVKANFTSNGLIETGHDYDEYVDNQMYFWVSNTGNAGVLEFKKKSIMEIFEADRTKMDAFFRAHKGEDIDEKFVRGLVDYLNQF
jgi:hypothetical protein